MIKVSDLTGSFSPAPRGPREELWQDLFLDPSQWWEHGSEKEHQSCQSSHVNGAICLIGVNRVAHFILLWSRLWQERFSDPLHLWDSSSRLEKVSRCNMLGQNSLADGECHCSFLCSNDITGVWDVENACVISLISR